MYMLYVKIVKFSHTVYTLAELGNITLKRLAHGLLGICMGSKKWLKLYFLIFLNHLPINTISTKCPLNTIA